VSSEMSVCEFVLVALVVESKIHVLGVKRHGQIFKMYHSLTRVLGGIEDFDLSVTMSDKSKRKHHYDHERV
jgi:hypothetical protein